MVKDDLANKKLQAEITHLKKQEADKRVLFDKSIGGENALRPSDDFIKKSVGPLKSETQIRKEAEENIGKQNMAEERDAANRIAVERSMREHTVKVEQQRQQTRVAQVRLESSRGGPSRGRSR